MILLALNIISYFVGHMTEADMKDIVFTNMYWFSLPLIGFALTIFIKTSAKTPSCFKNIADYTLKQHPFTILLLSYTLTVFIFAVFSIPFYLFNLPAVMFVVIYLALVMASVFILTSTSYKQIPQSSGAPTIGDTSLISKIIFFTFILILIFDFTLATCGESCGVGDALYHISRVVDILSSGFNVQSSFHSNLPEGGYHFNVVYALYAVPAALLNIEPMIIWRYSIAFFRLITWLTTFYLASNIFSRWLELGKKYIVPLSIFSVITSMVYFADLSFIANYPRNMAITWVTLLILGLSYEINDENVKTITLSLLATAFLITTTHPVYSLATSGFIVLFVFMRFLFQKRDLLKDKLSIPTYLSTIAILAISPLYTKLVPTRLSADLVSMDTMTPHIEFITTIIKPELISNGFRGWIVLTSCIISYIFIIYKLRKRKFQLSMAITLMTFYILIAYTPICTLLNRFIPLWAISRFDKLSLLTNLSIVIATLALADAVKYVVSKCGKSKNAPPQQENIFYLGFTLLVVGLSFPFILDNQGDALFDKRAFYETVKPLTAQYSGILNNNALVVADPDYGYMLSSLFPIDVISMTFGHAATASDGINRFKCLIYILSTYDARDLRSVGANFVVIDKNDSARKQMADSKPYLKLINDDSLLYIYSFNSDSTEGDGSPYEPCLLYQINESK